MKYLFILILCLLLCSCGPTYPKSTNGDNPEIAIYTQKVLPKNYTELKSLGNDWITFKLNIDGKEYKFLGRHLSYNNATLVKLD